MTTTFRLEKSLPTFAWDLIFFPLGHFVHPPALSQNLKTNFEDYIKFTTARQVHLLSKALFFVYSVLYTLTHIFFNSAHTRSGGIRATADDDNTHTS